MAQIKRVFALDEDNSLDLAGLLRSDPAVDLIHLATSFAEAAQKLTILVPDLILYHPAESGNEFKHLQALAELCPPAAIVVLATHRDSDYVRQCLRAGAHDYILLPIDSVVLQTEIDKTFTRNQRRQKTETLSVLMGNFTGGPKLLSFVSAKGGVGRTTLAVNTAVALAKFGKRVALVDLDLDSGGDDVLLNLNPKHTVEELALVPMEEISRVVSDYVEMHDSGVAVLCTPRDAVQLELMSPALVRVVLQSLQRNYEYVIVDQSPTITGILLTVLEISNECFMVSTPNLTVMQSTRNLLDLLVKLDYDMNKISHVLNCAGVKNGLRLTDVERLLKAPVRIAMEYDYNFVEQALNKGIPFVQWKESHSLSKSVKELARMIIGINRKPKRDRKKI